MYSPVHHTIILLGQTYRLRNGLSKFHMFSYVFLHSQRQARDSTATPFDPPISFPYSSNLGIPVGINVP